MECSLEVSPSFEPPNPLDQLFTPAERVSYLNSLLALPERRWRLCQFGDQDVNEANTYIFSEGKEERYIGAIMVQGNRLRTYRYQEGLIGEIRFSAWSEAEALSWANDLVVDRR